jgi:hypothetical protein
MKAKFIVNPSLKPGNAGLETIKTDMLMLTKLGGLGLGPGPKAVDKLLEGKLSRRIQQRRFKGELGEHLTLQLGEENAARNVLLVGLGSAADLDYCGMQQVIKVAITRAISMGCTRISLDMPKNRITAARMNLVGTAKTLKDCVEDALAEVAADKDGVLEFELICSPQAAPHLKRGLAIQRRAEKKVECSTHQSKGSELKGASGRKK